MQLEPVEEVNVGQGGGHGEQGVGPHDLRLVDERGVQATLKGTVRPDTGLQFFIDFFLLWDGSRYCICLRFLCLKYSNSLKIILVIF